jgi:hypothetical protein
VDSLPLSLPDSRSVAQDVGKKVKKSKQMVSWNFYVESAGCETVLTLINSKSSGKKRITFDTGQSSGADVMHSEKTPSGLSSWQHSVSTLGHEFVVKVSGGAYELLVDGWSFSRLDKRQAAYQQQGGVQPQGQGFQQQPPVQPRQARALQTQQLQQRLREQAQQLREQRVHHHPSGGAPATPISSAQQEQQAEEEREALALVEAMEASERAALHHAAHNRRLSEQVSLTPHLIIIIIPARSLAHLSTALPPQPSAPSTARSAANRRSLPEPHLTLLFRIPMSYTLLVCYLHVFTYV